MSFQSVPWFIGGGAENPPEAARLLAHVATRSARGVVLPGDCEGRESAVPDTNVRIMPGALVIPNGGTGAAADSYLARAGDQTSVPITATGAGETRSDLVYVRVADPQTPGEPTPADVAHGPYVWPEVVAGVDPTTKTVGDAIDQGLIPPGTTGYEVMRVDMPESTATVTQAIIADLRRVANPRVEPVQRTVSLTDAETDVLNNGSANGEHWPQFYHQIEVPEWATRVQIAAFWGQAQFRGGNVWGRLWVEWGPYQSTQKWREATQKSGFDVVATSNNHRETMLMADTRPVPADLRGTTQPFVMKGSITDTSGSFEYPQLDWASSIMLQVTFHETVESIGA